MSQCCLTVTILTLPLIRMMDSFQFYVGLVIALLILLSARNWNRKNLLPPGPKGYPLIGNVFDVPKGYDALGWAKFRDLYGRSDINDVLESLI